MLCIKRDGVHDTLKLFRQMSSEKTVVARMKMPHEMKNIMYIRVISTCAFPKKKKNI